MAAEANTSIRAPDPFFAVDDLDRDRERLAVLLETIEDTFEGIRTETGLSPAFGHLQDRARHLASRGIVLAALAYEINEAAKATHESVGDFIVACRRGRENDHARS